MQFTNSLKKMSKRTKVIIGVVVIAVLATIFIFKSAEEEQAQETKLPTIEVASAAQLSGSESLSVIGSVRAFTEAEITTERAGRVTSVQTQLGATVRAGQVVATLENASERASVLQAQGAYEAAVASANQSNLSVAEAETNITAAKNNLVTTIRSGYNTTNAVVRNDIDDFYGDPDRFIPGLKLNGFGQTNTLNNERVAYQTLLPAWQQRVNALSVNSDLDAEASYTIANINRTISFLDSFISLLQLQDNSVYTDSEIQSFTTTLTASRASLLQSVSSIESAQSSLESAEEARIRAQVSASGGAASASDAQVKQALGSLRAAEANLAKTILRTPISGTVNSLDIKLGDFVGSFETVSIVANNEALEIVTFVSDDERNQLSVGETVLIEGEYEGIITNIAPAVDSTTRKTEVRVAVDSTEIANGDTVRITKEYIADSVPDNEFFIPITAVKFEAENGVVFVVKDGTLESVPVVVGRVRGATVEILEGITNSTEFVLDARGLTEGEKVQVKL